MAELTNDSDRTVEISELTVQTRPWHLLRLRWGATEVPARVAPGESWTGSVVWRKPGARTPLSARLVIDGEAQETALRPATRAMSTRARLQQHNLGGAVLAGFLVLGVANWIVAGGYGFLGLGLATAGTVSLVAGLKHYVAGFGSSGACALLVLGGASTGAGSAIIMRAGFDASTLAILLVSLLFSQYRVLAGARQVRATRRSRHAQLAQG
jgi:hypothetical protein